MNDGTWTYTWEHGRQLASMSNGSTTWSYTYDANGMRTSRTDGTTSYSYIYNGGQLVQETITSSSSRSVLNYFYDAGGSPLYVVYNNVPYFYVLNLQGDVVALISASGTKVVEYTYDAWGNILTTTGSLASTLGQQNALRYRGYVFDRETGLYYLQSRYYNPEIGRFINADASVSTGQGILSNNMFAYCLNNPVNGSDPCGNCFHFFWLTCEECDGKTLGEKWDEFTQWCEETVDDIVTFHQQQESIQRQIQQEQLNIIQDFTQSSIDLIAETQMLQIEVQRQQEKIVQDFVADRFSTPEKTKNTLAGIAIALDSTSKIFTALAVATAIPSSGISVPYAGAAAAVTGLLSIPFFVGAWLIDIEGEE